MALADHFDEADVLSSLAWVGMTTQARTARLASLYIANEDNIEGAHRNYLGPTLGTVRVFIKSVYSPPRGQGSSTYTSVLEEINEQKSKRQLRAAGRRPAKSEQQPTVRERRNLIARNAFSIWGSVHWSASVATQLAINCIGITRIAGCRLILDGGGNYPTAYPRIHIQHLDTNRVKVVVVDTKHTSSVDELLMQMAPRAALRGMYEGRSTTLDFDGNGFLVDDTLVPWRHVVKIYTGRSGKPIKTAAKPQRV